MRIIRKIRSVTPQSLHYILDRFGAWGDASLCARESQQRTFQAWRPGPLGRIGFLAEEVSLGRARSSIQQARNLIPSCAFIAIHPRKLAQGSDYALPGTAGCADRLHQRPVLVNCASLSSPIPPQEQGDRIAFLLWAKQGMVSTTRLFKNQIPAIRALSSSTPPKYFPSSPTAELELTTHLFLYDRTKKDE